MIIPKEADTEVKCSFSIILCCYMLIRHEPWLKEKHSNALYFALKRHMKC